MAKGKSPKPANGSALDFEAQLGAAADKMRGHMNLAAGAPVSDPASFRVTVTNAPDRRSAFRFAKRCPIQRNADSFRADLPPDLKADFVPVWKDLVTATRASAKTTLAKPNRRSVGATELHPPFNMSDWDGENLRQDVRCFSLSASNAVPRSRERERVVADRVRVIGEKRSFAERAGVRCRIHSSPVNNANYGWIQHFIHHLSPVGVAGFVLANGSMSTQASSEGELYAKA
jgi:hypothetical protein